jgi:rare lipoprotein A
VRRSLFVLLLATACSSTETTTRPPASITKSAPRSSDHVQFGDATFYGKPHQGGPTASGERFNMYGLTAAHLHLPMNTKVRVTNLRNGRSVVVRINDRGPYGNRKRIIDLSYAAARELDMIEAGVVPVRVEIVAWP